MEYSPAFLDGLRTRFALTADPDHEVEVHGAGPKSRQHRFAFDTLPEVIDFCGPIDGQRILELGCGTGSITVVLAEHAASVVAFDIDEASVALCRERLAQHSLTNVTVECGTTYEPPPPDAPDDERFDLVVMHAVMEHVPRSVPGLRRQVLRSAMAALRPGGHLFIYETPNRLWPKDIHTTGLWFLPWTKAGSQRAYDRAVRAGQHRPAAADEAPIALEARGAWGMTYWELTGALDEGTYSVVNLEPGHDRWVRPGRRLGRGRRAYETAVYATLTRPFHIPVVALCPMLSPLVVRKLATRDGPDHEVGRIRAARAADARVAAIIVTHDRPDVLAGTLTSVLTQRRPADVVLVVDSGSTGPGTHEVLADHPDVHGVFVEDNVGYGAALAIGIDEARATHDPDFFWLLDDDSPVAPDALERVLAFASGVERLGIVGTTGGHVRLGVPRWIVPSPPGAYDADLCMVDGALLSRAAVLMCGTPRRDFFMMHEDLEYTTRIHGSGLRVVVSDAVHHDPMHLGTAAPGTTVSYWRDYYQSRNHLRFLLDRGARLGLLGWFARESAIVVAGLRRGRGGITKARVVVRGARDAVRGTMGRTVEPGSI